jgi:hypothetical protein
LFRLNHKNIRSSWIPVKHVDVLSDVAPDLAMQIAQLEHGLGMRTAGQSHSDEGRNRIEAAVVNFGVSLASEYSHLITPQELSEGLPKQAADIGYTSGVETRRQMFQAMADYVTDRFHFTPDPTTAERPRESAYSAAGLNLDGSIKMVPPRSTLSTAAGDYSGAIIDSEIVAIYW